MSYDSIKHKGGTGDCSYLSLKLSEVALSITRSQRVYNGRRIIKYNRVFSKCIRMAIMPMLASEALFRENKKFQQQNVTPVSIEPLDL